MEQAKNRLAKTCHPQQLWMGHIILHRQSMKKAMLTSPGLIFEVPPSNTNGLAPASPPNSQ
jgi:hypothetical protein